MLLKTLAEEAPSRASTIMYAARLPFVPGIANPSQNDLRQRE
jgi:hypothetical protein